MKDEKKKEQEATTPNNPLAEQESYFNCSMVPIENLDNLFAQMKPQNMAVVRPMTDSDLEKVQEAIYGPEGLCRRRTTRYIAD